MEGSRLKVVAASDPNYTRTLETAIRVGDPMLLKVGRFLSLTRAVQILFSLHIYRAGDI